MIQRDIPLIPSPNTRPWAGINSPQARKQAWLHNETTTKAKPSSPSRKQSQFAKKVGTLIDCSILHIASSSSSSIIDYYVGGNRGAGNIRCGRHFDAKHWLTSQSAAQKGLLPCVSASVRRGRHHRRHQGKSLTHLMHPAFRELVTVDPIFSNASVYLPTMWSIRASNFASDIHSRCY